MLDKIFREYYDRKQREGGFNRADMYAFVQKYMSEGYKKSSILNMLSRMRGLGLNVPTMNGKGDTPLFESFAEFVENNPVEDVQKWIDVKKAEGYKDRSIYQELKGIQKQLPELPVPKELLDEYKVRYATTVDERNRDLTEIRYDYVKNLLEKWLSSSGIVLFCGLLLACGRRVPEMWQDFQVEGNHCRIGKQAKIKNQVEFCFPLICKPEVFEEAFARFHRENTHTEMKCSNMAVKFLKEVGFKSVKDLRALYAAVAYKEFGYGVSEHAFYSDVLGHTGAPSYATSTYTRFVLV